ncbi:hypothetical protein DPMN_014908 [Dreissena polymorpha]|uniref:Calcineurin-like phosphoesterase domain-containing protein n=1 Tax=Dreissena polymorpha TaxID=45954 RepID=A0A9D4S358_DREPO|nr:hypothetical protein DPMN_014908 [Dreissena polymorpha]
MSLPDLGTMVSALVDLFSSADYIVVGGHHPVYSVGKHGPSTCLRRKLEPLLHTYGVSVYIAGHDHNVQVWSII